MLRYVSAGSIFLLLIFVFILGLTINVGEALAQSTGVTLIPASIEQRASPGEVIKETLIITNESDNDREYFLFTRDIKGVEGGGVPIFAEEGLEPTGYEVSEWISLEAESVTVHPNERYELPVTITVPENASPGSHFGGIFVSVEPPRLREIGAGVGYDVVSIVSLRINGDVVDDARVRAFSTDRLFYGSKDVQFLVRIENQGNILIRPRGPLTITNMFGGDPEIIIVNNSQAGVFPGTIRDVEARWKKDGLGFGRYEAIVALSYDGEGGQKTITASLYFWIFPTGIMISIFVSFAVLGLGGWFITRLYINRAIMRAAGGRRIPAARYRRQVGISRFAFVFITLMAVLALFLIVLLIFFA